MRRLLSVGAASGFLGFAAGGSAAACPFCDTATGEAVRARLFDASFWPTVAAILLPFLVCAVIVVGVRFGRRSRPEDD